MEASHAYDFERPGEPVLFAPSERLWMTGYLSWFTDWDTATTVYFEDEVPILRPTEKEFIAARERRGPTFHVFTPDFEVQEPTLRPLSWDGNRVLLPTGHWEAAHYRGEMRRWWEWDVLGEEEGRDIRRAAAPTQFRVGWLGTYSFMGGLTRYPDKWLSSKKLEEALVKDLEAVRTRRVAKKPNLDDPRVVYEIGEHVLSGGYKRQPVWRRFAAFVEEGA